MSGTEPQRILQPRCQEQNPKGIPIPRSQAVNALTISSSFVQNSQRELCGLHHAGSSGYFCLKKPQILGYPVPELCRHHTWLFCCGDGATGHVLLLHLGLGIPSGSKTAPEKGMEEEINGNKICLEAAATAGESQLPLHRRSALPGPGSRPARPLPAPWGEFGGVWGCSVFQRSSSRVPSSFVCS